MTDELQHLLFEMQHDRLSEGKTIEVPKQDLAEAMCKVVVLAREAIMNATEGKPRAGIDFVDRTNWVKELEQ